MAETFIFHELMERDSVARQTNTTLKYDNAVLTFKLETGRDIEHEDRGEVNR
jgi:hypothetical protein